MCQIHTFAHNELRWFKLSLMFVCFPEIFAKIMKITLVVISIIHITTTQVASSVFHRTTTTVVISAIHITTTQVVISAIHIMTTQVVIAAIHIRTTQVVISANYDITATQSLSLIGLELQEDILSFALTLPALLWPWNKVTVIRTGSDSKMQLGFLVLMMLL